jgi:biotin carboxyl carrier protein
MKADRSGVSELVAVAQKHRLTLLRVEKGSQEVCVELPASGQPAPDVRAAVKTEFRANEPKFIKSPLVGYFRGSGALELGGRVEKGSVVGVIEALGLPNELQSQVAGVVTEVLVDDGQPVEYGQAIARVEES